MSTMDLEHLLAELDDMDLEGLRQTWRERFGAPPSLRSAPIMRMLIAWRLQCQAFGGLDPETRKAIARTGVVAPEGRHLGIGARLTRNWKGREVEVVVEEQGFRWENRLYPSLSAAATAIAGTRWNGPRFFGLRDAA